MNDKDIIRITKVNNVRVENLHDGFLFPAQDFLEIETRGGDVRILSLIAERDITDIDYLKLKETDKTKKRDLFKENMDDNE